MKKIVAYSDFIKQIKNICETENLDLFFPNNEQDFVYCTPDSIFIENLALTSIRTISPIKLLFFPPKEEIISSYIVKKRIILGVKSCDVYALKLLDKMFLEENTDEMYKNYRNNSLIISTDCIYPQEHCFCSLVGNKPYVEKDENVSDINISFVDDNNLILESYSSAGEEILNKWFKDYEEPTRTEEIKRDSTRNLAVKKILEVNSDFIKEEKQIYYKTLKKEYENNEVWKKESEKCVQCGGCNFICPSCYCFLIREASENYQKQYRDKVWDVCHFTGYARVAGGANPRKYKFQRFRNRYQCKFVYRYENFGFYACTGCGRCIDVCPAKIDIRKVVRNLVLAKGEQILVQSL